MEVVSIHLRANLTASSVVLCGTLAIEFGDAGLLESCYYWLAAHLVSTGRLAPSFFGYTVDAGMIPAIEGDEFVHRMFRLNQSVFRNISRSLNERRAPYSQYVRAELAKGRRRGGGGGGVGRGGGRGGGGVGRGGEEEEAGWGGG